MKDSLEESEDLKAIHISEFISSALEACFMSETEYPEDESRVNVTQALYAIAHSIHRLATVMENRR